MYSLLPFFVIFASCPSCVFSFSVTEFNHCMNEWRVNEDSYHSCSVALDRCTQSRDYFQHEGDVLRQRNEEVGQMHSNLQEEHSTCKGKVQYLTGASIEESSMDSGEVVRRDGEMECRQEIQRLREVVVELEEKLLLARRDIDL